MRWQKLLSNTYLHLSEEYENILDGLTLDNLHKCPAPGANTVGWLLWHARFGCNPDPNETGVRHSFKELGEFRVPEI